MKLRGRIERKGKEFTVILDEAVRLHEGKELKVLKKNDVTGYIPYPTCFDYIFSCCILNSGKLKIYDYEETGYTVFDFLASLKGLSETSASRIYSLFGEDSLKVIKEDPESLKEVKGLNDIRIKKIEIALAERTYAKEYFQYFQKFGIDGKEILKVFKISSDKVSLAKLKRNPYPFFSFASSEKIRKKEGIEDDFYPRIKYGVLEVLEQAETGGEVFMEETSQPEFIESYLSYPELEYLGKGVINKLAGSTCLIKEDIRYLLIKLTDQKVGREMMCRILTELATEGRVRLVTSGGKVYVYLKDKSEIELGSAKKISELTKKTYPHDKKVYRVINSAEAELGIKLSNEQTDAVRMAIENQFSVLTGGPGTGKTSVQKAIIKVFRKYNPGKDVVMCAPTGKAAKRMGESTGEKATTIHRLLGLKLGSDTEEMMSVTKKVSNSLIIIDEVSMIDAKLFYALTKSIGDDMNVVMVGDIDQLPSIGAGSILKELIKSGVVPVTRLTKTFRQTEESVIPINAARIRIGETRLESGSDFIFRQIKSSPDIAEEAANLVVDEARKDGIENVVCLTAYRRSTETGSNALNERIRGKLRGKELSALPYFESNGVKIYEGDRVMYTRNSGELINGDTGMVKKIVNERGHVNCDLEFGDISVTLSDEALQDLVLAYALTIHKSQGSEYKTVVMVVDKAHERLNRRNLIYTGVTRTSEKLYVVGDVIGEESALSTAIKRQDSSRRISLLSKALAKYSSK